MVTVRIGWTVAGIGRLENEVVMVSGWNGGGAVSARFAPTASAVRTRPLGGKPPTVPALSALAALVALSALVACPALVAVSAVCAIRAWATGGLPPRPAVRARNEAICSRVTRSFGQ